MRGRILLVAVVLALMAGTLLPSGVARAAQDELPDGDGRKILQSACTTCHDLQEVTKFKGYYTRDDWRDVIVTMREYGAPLQDKEADTLAAYLTAAIGKKESK